MNKEDKFAFPTETKNIADDSQILESCGGLTRREYFAAHIMQGLLTRSIKTDDPKYITCKAVDIADALIRELEA